LRRHLFFTLVQICAIAWAIHWWRHLPAPGYAIGVLAVLAAAMSIHGEMLPWHKAVWMLLIGVFLIIEFRAIDRDRANYSNTETAKRIEERKQFQAIADGISATIANSDKQFAATMSGIRQNIDTITGGTTYCYVVAGPVGNDFLLTVNTVGSSPLHDVYVELVDLDMLKSLNATGKLLTLDAIQSFTTYYPSIPFLVSSSGHMLGKLPIEARDKRDLHFNFFSMNGVWGETLKLRRLNGNGWTEAIKVDKQLKGNRQKTIYTYVSPDYPKAGGKVDW
jgi:hypothetical protein